MEVLTNGHGLGQCGNDFHLAPANRALGHPSTALRTGIYAEDSCQETGPGEAVDRLGRRGLLGVRAALRWRFLRPRHNAIASSGIGRQHAVIANKVQARRRDKGGELFDQFQGRKNEVGGPPSTRLGTGSGPSSLECETERIVVEDAELARSQWRPYDPSIRPTKEQVGLLRAGVTAQSLEARSVVGLDTGRRIHGESTGGKA